MILARIAQHAENAFVGVQSGLMDQFAVAAGRADAALLLDCRSRGLAAGSSCPWMRSRWSSATRVRPAA